MRKSDLHLSDQVLLLYVDGELPFGQAWRTRVHLTACWECRARMADLETTIVDFVRAHHDSFDPTLQPIAGPRALLKARMSELAKRTPPSRFWQRSAVLGKTVFGYGFALLLLSSMSALLVYRQTKERETISVNDSYVAALPDRALTPGAIQPEPLVEICSSPHDQVVRRVSKPVREQVFREYGIADAPAEDYEIDHLITPGLGGSDDIRNLWPEPHYHTEWNSYVKDQLEDHLHYLVCSGQLNLSTAQRDISSNWISAYQKYFHTASPLLPYSASGGPTASNSTPMHTSPAPAEWFHLMGHPRMRVSSRSDITSGEALAAGLLVVPLLLLPLVTYHLSQRFGSRSKDEAGDDAFICLADLVTRLSHGRTADGCSSIGTRSFGPRPA